jgi:hypothetical protein
LFDEQYALVSLTIILTVHGWYCYRSVVFSGYSGFLHQYNLPPWYPHTQKLVQQLYNQYKDDIVTFYPQTVLSPVEKNWLKLMVHVISIFNGGRWLVFHIVWWTICLGQFHFVCIMYHFIAFYIARQHNGQKFQDTKWVIRNHKSKKDRQHNGQKKDKRSFPHCLMNNMPWSVSFRMHYVSLHCILHCSNVISVLKVTISSLYWLYNCWTSFWVWGYHGGIKELIRKRDRPCKKWKTKLSDKYRKRTLNIISKNSFDNHINFYIALMLSVF